MNTKKLIIIFLFPLMTDLIVSCCDCEKQIYHRYTHSKLTLRNIDNSGSGPVESTSDSIIKTAYGIRLHIDRMRTACFKKDHTPFMSSAFANKCECPPIEEYMAKDSIISMEIYTLYDFDSTHPANSDVSDHFKIYQNHTYKTIHDYLKERSSTLYREGELQMNLDLLLMTPPVINKKHKFKIKIALSDSRTFEEETTLIELF